MESEIFPVKFAYTRTGFYLLSYDSLLVYIFKLTANPAGFWRPPNISRSRKNWRECRLTWCYSGGTRCDHQAGCSWDLEQENYLFVSDVSQLSLRVPLLGAEKKLRANDSSPSKATPYCDTFTACTSGWSPWGSITCVDRPRTSSDTSVDLLEHPKKIPIFPIQTSLSSWPLWENKWK